MEAPIIVPRDHERVLDLPLPQPLVTDLQSRPARCTVTIAYVTTDGGCVEAATQEYPPLDTKPRTGTLRKRLPPPPPDLCALRLSIDGAPATSAIDLAAIAPELAEYAQGAILLGDLPDHLPAGTREIPITVRNDSAFPWAGGPSGVMVRLDLDGEVSHLPLPGPVPAGAEQAFTIACALPDAPGEYPLHCTLVLAPSLPFVRGRSFQPGRARIEIAPAPTASASLPTCRISIQPPADPLLPAEPAILAARLANTGHVLIEAADPGGLRLRARWRRVPRDGGPVRDPVTVMLPYRVPPDAQCTVALDVTPPVEPGTYLLDVFAELIGTGTRLDRDHCDCPAVTVTVADPGTLDKAVERAIRRDGRHGSDAAARAAYRDWAQACDSFADAADAVAASGLEQWPALPLVGITLPSDLSPDERTRAQHWLAGQPYPAWRLASDCATPDLLLRWDPREGLLADHALVFLAGECVRRPDVAYVYADFDHLDESGRHNRVFLPAPDAFFARAQPEVATIAAVRPAALAAAGLSIDDPRLAARLLADLPPAAVAHVPEVLLHRYRRPAPYLGTSFSEDGWRLAKMHDSPGYAVHATLAMPAPRVALIIPTRDRLDLLSACIGTILDRTDYPSFEIIVVDNGSEAPDTLDYLAALEAAGTARVLRDAGDFNWSRLNNRAAALTDADMLCFLNNDMEATSEHWLRELVALAARPDVGVAGPTLWFPDGTMQHVGVVFSSRGSPLHPFRAAPRGTAPFYLRSLRSQPAVTGACLTVRRAVFDAVGGFAECFPLGFNDIDFCMRVTEVLGLPSVCTPAAELLHKESASRGRLRSEADHARFLHDLALFEGRHLETALANRWAVTIAHEARRGAPLTMVTRRPQGARLAARRLRRMGARPIAFLHIPKTAGTAVRRVLERALPERAVLSIGARAVLEGHAAEPMTVTRLAPLLREAEVLVSHVSRGFGEAVGWPCDYATVLRQPRDRVRSHHGFLVAPPNAPLRDTPLADWSLAQLLRKGVIPGNLMLAKILGTPPENVGWAQVDGRFPRYVGFGLPPALWRGDKDALADLPDVTPDDDEAKVAAALAIIRRDFVFVGLQEQLEDHLADFGRLIDLPTIGRIPRVNAARGDEAVVCAEDLAAIDRYNALDQLLYDAIAAEPGGLFLRDRPA